MLLRKRTSHQGGLGGSPSGKKKKKVRSVPNEKEPIDDDIGGALKKVPCNVKTKNKDALSNVKTKKNEDSLFSKSTKTMGTKILVKETGSNGTTVAMPTMNHVAVDALTFLDFAVDDDDLTVTVDETYEAPTLKVSTSTKVTSTIATQATKKVVYKTTKVASTLFNNAKPNITYKATKIASTLLKKEKKVHDY